MASTQQTIAITTATNWLVVIMRKWKFIVEYLIVTIGLQPHSLLLFLQAVYLSIAQHIKSKFVKWECFPSPWMNSVLFSPPTRKKKSISNHNEIHYLIALLWTDDLKDYIWWVQIVPLRYSKHSPFLMRVVYSVWVYVIMSNAFLPWNWLFELLPNPSNAQIPLSHNCTGHCAVLFSK